MLILCSRKLLYIGYGLYEALIGLRRTMRDHHDLAVTSEDLSSPRLGPRPLRNRIWIDAVCINQSHLEERSTQVKMMHLIYKKADAVLIWLGPQDEVIRQAVRAMLNPPLSSPMASLSSSIRWLFSHWQYKGPRFRCHQSAVGDRIEQGRMQHAGHSRPRGRCAVSTAEDIPR